MKEIGIFGYKCGMSTFFTNTGDAIPVTIIKIYKNYIIDKNKNKNLENIIKIAACEKKKNFKNKTLKNNLKYIKEYKIDQSKEINYNIGDELSSNFFSINENIIITGTSKGKGFAGVIKRHNFNSQRATHGNSLSHRVPGSIGQCQDPGKVFKGKKMAGHLGVNKVTIKNIKIIDICKDLETIIIKGSIPGCNGSKVIIKKNIK